MEANFEVDEIYSAKEIANHVGGSWFPYLPISGGRIVAGRFNLEMNPAAPNEVLVQDAPRIMQAAQILFESGDSIPVFVKRRKTDSGFRYLGRYKCVQLSTNPVELEQRQRLVSRPLGAFFNLKRVGD